MKSKNINDGNKTDKPIRTFLIRELESLLFIFQTKGIGPFSGEQIQEEIDRRKNVPKGIV